MTTTWWADLLQQLTRNYPCPGKKRKRAYKERGNDGIKDSYFHMSPTRGDASQGTFFDIPSILVYRRFLHIKERVQIGIEDSYVWMSPIKATFIRSFFDISYITNTQKYITNSVVFVVLFLNFIFFDLWKKLSEIPKYIKLTHQFIHTLLTNTAHIVFEIPWF